LVVHWHYPGHGRTQAPLRRDHLTIADLADGLRAVLDDSGIQRAVVVGHSMGVQVALEMFRRHRDRVAGLILICGAASHPLQSFRRNRALEDALPVIRRWVSRAPRLANRLARAVLPTKLAYEVAARLEIRRDLVTPEDFQPYLDGVAHVDADLFLELLDHAGRHSGEDVLPQIDVPTLVVAGERDGFTPIERSREMATAIPGAQLLVGDGSHTLPIEHPELLNCAVGDFLRSRVDVRELPTSTEKSRG
jgi:pimeloyl-ACP methyl ester carboxylesterase